jgi:hypothetical protein
MNSIFLADATDAGAFGIGGLIVFVPILLIWYSIMCLLVPLFIYGIMRNTTRSEALLKKSELTLRRIEWFLTPRDATQTDSIDVKINPDAAFISPEVKKDPALNI